MKLSVIICCYNEREFIEQVIENTLAVDIGQWKREIIVVDNCSTDGTRDILHNIECDPTTSPEVKIVYHAQNMGKGQSIRTGIAHMNGDYMLIQDADLEYDPADHRHFCDFARKHRPAALFGSRVLGGKIITQYQRTYWGNQLLTLITNLLFGGTLTDVATATKMVRADVIHALNLTTTDFNLDFELPNKILLAGYKIDEIPISYRPRTYAEGKKIQTKHGLFAILTMLRDWIGITPVFASNMLPSERDMKRMVDSVELGSTNSISE